MHRNTSEHIAQGARWMRCEKQADIAEAVGTDQQTVSKIVENTQNDTHVDSRIFRDFEPKIYTAWSWRPPTETPVIYRSLPARVDLACHHRPGPPLRPQAT